MEDLLVAVGYQLQLSILFVVTSLDAQTRAAPQASHYLRGDKFEKPMGTIVQARAQVNYPATQAEIHDRRGTQGATNGKTA